MLAQGAVHAKVSTRYRGVPRHRNIAFLIHINGYKKAEKWDDHENQGNIRSGTIYSHSHQFPRMGWRCEIVCFHTK